MKKSFERVLRALDELRAGKIVILTDDEDRENEGDFVMAADHVTPEAINFMAKFGRGLVCLSLTEERVKQLELPMMVDDNRSSRSTAFTVSIEAREGVTTGISAADRARTIKVAIAPDTTPNDLVSPGHVFPLKGCPGGVLQRSGHTEGAVDLARLAGCTPAGVICEIMNDDGTMARHDDLVALALEKGLHILSIADLISYRLQTETLVRRVKSGELALGSGRRWHAHVYATTVENREFLALTLGDIHRESTLVRVHTESPLGDVFHSRVPLRMLASEAMARIESEGSGVILFLPRRASLASDLAGHLGEKTEVPPGNEGEVLREFGLGAQVLADLGVRRIRLLSNRPRRIVGLEGFGLEVIEQVVLDANAEVPEDSMTH
jgi:3,4-dihydroxy 2-butanone 4-phosphate synthase/GTP cyclohydrolase II